MRDNIGYALPVGTTTLAGRFREAGYATAGFVSSYPLRSNTGIAQGYSLWDDEYEEASSEAGIGEIQRSGAHTVDRALAWLGEREDDRFLLFVHLFEPHLPYDAPEPFASRYASPYDAEIAYTDTLVGRLLDALREQGLYDGATIALLSDHGEGLGEHGEDDHGLFVYSSTLQVPLLLKMPGNSGANERVEAAVQLADVAPTLLRIGAAAPLPDAIGTDLIASTEPRSPVYSETYQPRLHFGWSELLSVIDYPYHYIEAPEPELYDLEADPLEETNLIASSPAIVQRLRGQLQPLVVDLQGPTGIDAATRDRLAALGYVTGGTASATGNLADPKNKIHLLRHLKVATALYFAGDDETAIAEFETALAEDPGMTSAWEFLGRAQRRAGRLADAAASFSVLASLGGGSSHTDLVLAGLYLDLGDSAESAAAANRALSDFPAAARVVLARLAFREGNYPSALTLGRRALDADAASVGAHLVVGEALLQQGDVETAQRHADAALLGSDDPGPAHVLRGRALMLGRQPAAALVEFERAIASDHGYLPGYVYLAATHFAGDQRDRGLATLEEMVRQVPEAAVERRAIDTLRSFGLIAEAERWYEAALTRYPNAPELDDSSLGGGALAGKSSARSGSSR